MKASRNLALLLVTAGVSACALMPKHHAFTKITPVSTPLAATGQLDDGSYADAVRAINARDYATALEALENARHRDANDIRVLNAFGVVYDKLGRFDVSAHYYALASAIDPASAIVKQNVAYSALLQRAARHEAGPALAAAITPKPTEVARPAQVATAVTRLGSPVGRLVEIAPGISRIEGPVGPSPVLALPRGITGHALALVDASGGHGVEPVRVALTRLGWTAPRLAASTAPAQSRSQIIYPGTARVVALALARTLPKRVDMVVCADGCQGVRLVLGSDSLSWKHPGGRDAVHRV